MTGRARIALPDAMGGHHHTTKGGTHMNPDKKPKIPEIWIASADGLFETLQQIVSGWIGDNERGTWIFRGQADERWALRTTFERVRHDHFPTKKTTQASCRKRIQKVIDEEILLVRRFKRQAHLYVDSPPEPQAHLEWRALLRHHYGPARLMDCTYSAYVATFFALSDALGRDSNAAIWAINKNWLARCEKRYLKNMSMLAERTDFDDGDTFRRVFLEPNPETEGMVIAANPYRENQRLQLQQGLFLIPVRLDRPFQDNLLAMMDDQQILHSMASTKKLMLLPTQPRNASPVQKLVLSTSAGKMIEDSLRRLRKMNITAASLFPGLDGFAQSLNHWPLSRYHAKKIALERERGS
jgi:hypothetical protein